MFGVGFRSVEGRSRSPWVLVVTRDNNDGFSSIWECSVLSFDPWRAVLQVGGSPLPVD